MVRDGNIKWLVDEWGDTLVVTDSLTVRDGNVKWLMMSGVTL